VLRDPQSSSRHLEIDWDGERLLVRDLRSTNGSYVDGQRITERVLHAGDVVVIGGSRLEFIGVVGAGRTVVAMPAASIGGTQVAMVKAVTPTKPATTTTKTPANPSPRKPLSTAAKVVIGGGLIFGLLTAWVVAVVVMRGGAGGTMSTGEATVRAVWFSGTPKVKVQGGTSPVVVRIAKNDKPGVSVGVLEEFSGGSGNMWRTATWLAAFNASRTAGISLVDHEYLVRAGGHIDGPSAGMLITATMLALLNGDAIDPTTTMTGTINPDGSAGPVGGIVQKMQGAKEAGITRFGYPIGTRQHVDMADGTTVDLEEVGKRLGLEVREIADLSSAYAFLTKVSLAETTPVTDAEMQVDAETAQRLRAKLSTWKARVDREITELADGMRRRNLKDTNNALGPIRARLVTAEQYERSDLPVASLNAYVQALVSLRTTRQTMEMFELLGRRDFQGMKALVEGARTGAQRIDAFSAELKAASTKASVGGYVNLTNAMTSYVQAVALARFADGTYAEADAVAVALNNGSLKPSPEALTALTMKRLIPVVTYMYAETLLEQARDELDLVGDEGRAVTVQLDTFAREAGGFASAAGATLAYFEALEVEPLMERGLTMDQARARVGDAVFTYRIARSEVQLAEYMTVDPAVPSDQMVRLAAGIDAFLGSALLVNTYYALGGQRDKAGKIVLANRKALSAQLDLARGFAREAAARAQASAGFIPVAARLSYQLAGATREGDDDDKLAALQAYWQSAQWSELAARLAAP